MILQALVEYYERRARQADTSWSPEGFEQKEIPFVIVVDGSGQFVQIEDTRTDAVKIQRSKVFEVPRGANKAAQISANLLWDRAEYVLGIETVKYREKFLREQDHRRRLGFKNRLLGQHIAFKAQLAELPAGDEGVDAVQAFLSNIPWDQLEATDAWSDIIDGNPVLTFRLASESLLVCQRLSVTQFVRRRGDAVRHCTEVCLVTGEKASIERVHASIKGVWGAHLRVLKSCPFIRDRLSLTAKSRVRMLP